MSAQRKQSALRKQMQADMVLRGMAERTQQAYIGAVLKFAEYHGRKPDKITQEEVQHYLLYLLQERKLAHSSCNIVCSALQFLYSVPSSSGPNSICRAPRCRNACRRSSHARRSRQSSSIPRTSSTGRF